MPASGCHHVVMGPLYRAAWTFRCLESATRIGNGQIRAQNPEGCREYAWRIDSGRQVWAVPILVQSGPIRGLQGPHGQANPRHQDVTGHKVLPGTLRWRVRLPILAIPPVSPVCIPGLHWRHDPGELPVLRPGSSTTARVFGKVQCREVQGRPNVCEHPWTSLHP